ncbi:MULTISPECIES: hypothetical protein [Akkermansia]|jgi:hypothetical protein|uniref:hypothetical protein n=1 Tax=Akkermansia sp. TaxID=1872421 RepID=UPI001BFFBB3A|nr:MULTISPECIES: hypothetical protein [Akkermansia]MBT9600465.1 hypothetical protein [Akkermansia muciniphila]HJH95271.1 hypothetical protein [Akkermansiaceae bacterium]MBS7153238.1 hypothetical protein [Akkermansia sp.]MBT9562212.1 hypothetical protein [Candidatus Akkermansia timonensis]QWO86894.1 hypothetical protein J5W67_04240 [Candidatus Akkermansia timonensis]
MAVQDVREDGYIGRYQAQTNGFFMTHKRKVAVKDPFAKRGNGVLSFFPDMAESAALMATCREKPFPRRAEDSSGFL